MSWLPTSPLTGSHPLCTLQLFTQCACLPAVCCGHCATRCRSWSHSVNVRCTWSHCDIRQVHGFMLCTYTRHGLILCAFLVLGLTVTSGKSMASFCALVHVMVSLCVHALYLVPFCDILHDIGTLPWVERGGSVDSIGKLLIISFFVLKRMLSTIYIRDITTLHAQRTNAGRFLTPRRKTRRTLQSTVLSAQHRGSRVTF